MGRTEREFAALAAAGGIELGRRTIAGLSGRGPWADGLAAAPSPVRKTLANMHALLGGDALLLRAKAERALSPDFVLPNGQIVEVDEIQHFTTDRLRTLELYPPDVSLGFDLGTYRELCQRHHRSADGYRAAKHATDFPFPGGRRAQRAFLDAVRDLLAPHLTGHPVLRVPAPECDADLAFARVEHRLFETTAR
jgi:hypothetical protein